MRSFVISGIIKVSVRVWFVPDVTQRPHPVIVLLDILFLVGRQPVRHRAFQSHLFIERSTGRVRVTRPSDAHEPQNITIFAYSRTVHEYSENLEQSVELFYIDTRDLIFLSSSSNIFFNCPFVFQEKKRKVLGSCRSLIRPSFVFQSSGGTPTIQDLFVYRAQAGPQPVGVLATFGWCHLDRHERCLGLLPMQTSIHLQRVDSAPHVLVPQKTDLAGR